MAPAVHRIGHGALRVSDMESAKAFSTALGLPLTWDAEYRAAGPHFAFHLQDPAGNWLEVLAAMGAPAPPSRAAAG